MCDKQYQMLQRGYKPSPERFFLTDLLAILDVESPPAEERLEKLKAFIGRQKGFGDRSQELAVIAAVFGHYFKLNTDLKEVRWQQCQDFDDSDLEYGLWNMVVNNEFKKEGYDPLTLTMCRLETPNVNDEFEWDDYDPLDTKMPFKNWAAYRYFGMPYQDLTTAEFEVFEKLTPEQQDIILGLRTVSLKFQIFLQALWQTHGPYYFIYVFGRRADVTVTPKGIKIENENFQYNEETNASDDNWYLRSYDYFSPTNRNLSGLIRDDEDDENARTFKNF